MSEITFEQPLNELVRILLRIEYLFDTIDKQKGLEAIDSQLLCLNAIVSIVFILDRPDLKSKLTKHIHKQTIYLNTIHKLPDVDKQKLKDAINELANLERYFNHIEGKVAQNLRENDFLKHLQKQSLIPGGQAAFEVSSFYAWFNLSKEERERQVKNWLEPLALIRQTTTLLLRLLRGKANSKRVIALQGLHQEPLNTLHPIQLVSISVNSTDQVYPSISAGKHRLIVRFNDSNHLQSEETALRDITFTLSCCT